MEEQHGGAFEVGAFGELEFFDEGGFGGAHVLRSDATGGAGETAEQADRAGGEIRNLDAGHGNAVPSAAMASEQKTVKGRAFEFLQRAAAANKIMSAIADGMGIGIDGDLEPGKAVFLAQIHGDQNAEEIAGLVGDFLQKPLGIGKADDTALVVAPDVE